MFSSEQKLRNRSAPSPDDSAVKYTLDYLFLREELRFFFLFFRTSGISFFYLFPGFQVFFFILFHNSMRASELLAVTAGDELSPSLFLVRGRKRSRGYTVTIPITGVNRLAVDGMPASQRLFPWDYHTIWRAGKRSDIAVNVPGRKTQIVTHKGRYILANALQERGKSDEITSLLRHKSAKSKNYYIGVLPIKKGPETTS